MRWNRVFMWAVCVGTGVLSSALNGEGSPFYAASMVIAAMGFWAE
jgi:hypothetical protein